MDNIPLLARPQQQPQQQQPLAESRMERKTVWTPASATTSVLQRDDAEDSLLVLGKFNAFSTKVDFAVARAGAYSLVFNLAQVLPPPSSSSSMGSLFGTCLPSSPSAIPPLQVLFELTDVDKRRVIQRECFKLNEQGAGMRFDFTIPLETTHRVAISIHRSTRFYHALLPGVVARQRTMYKILVKLDQTSSFSKEEEKQTAAQLPNDLDSFLANFSTKSKFTHAGKRLETTKPQEEEAGVMSLPMLATRNGRFVEQDSGRDVILRGINVSGNTKQPIGWASHLSPYNKPITFVGRPFPLDEAEEHFARLESWGFNCLRFLVTWEAIEHAGPGRYDVDYLDYLEACIALAGKYNLYVVVDPHQDAWSRFTGGSGAPLWTLELAGLDYTMLVPTGAAFTHYTEQQDLRQMTWPQNYQRFACLHMFTLFFAGREFAPAFRVRSDWQPGDETCEAVAEEESKHITDFLQDCFLNSMRQIATRLAKHTHVLGFDSFNEPSSGFVGKDLGKLPDTIIPPGLVFRPGDAMATASGVSLKVSVATPVGIATPRYLGRWVNAVHASIWKRPGADIWQRLGIWRPTSSASYELLAPQYFVRNARTGVEYNFFRDFLAPFALRFQQEVREHRADWLIFVEGDAFGHTDFYWKDSTADGLVNASHWYDGFTLFTRRFNSNWTMDTDHIRPVFGKKNVRALHLNEVRRRRDMPRTFENVPLTLPLFVGEFGLPFDLNKKQMLVSEDYALADEALALYYSIFDELEVSSALWNYSTENSDEYGDMWNWENLSIYAHGRARGLRGFSRPFAPQVCGTRVRCEFDQDRGVFELTYLPRKENTHFPDVNSCTRVFCPRAHFDWRGDFADKIVSQNARVIVQERADGSHMLHVWATATAAGTQGVIEPVKLVITAQ